ncbi:FAD/NAD(P)-binding domain-containing protein [Xylona heveae TC161]|uniref:FAD/NAD(P)-binding domain-containing protein n=1 Tax=Xylona heveae (strain CBS 132557 / TC161) TaxID=1328760 RepID=A0A165H3X4_XYLHT|nr:FAD/NAD(P)-binding domain-containing protein [Xylona heveae TC161]KZF22952.1 FAD/NAD(P)-binding domain-containing protein [Xylona heveae TC161]
MPFKVIIVGGGLAGSLLANGLIKNNVDVEVFERDVAYSKREGYQIRLGAMALSGLHTCLSETACREIIGKFGRSGGQVYTTPILYSTDLTPLRGFNGKSQPYHRSAPISRVILRDALAEPLIKQNVIRYEKKYLYSEIVRGPDGMDKVHAFFEDGTVAEGDMLVAADGSGSKINTEAGPDNIVDKRDRCGFLAKGQLPKETLRRLPHQLRAGPLVIEDDGVVFIASAYLPDKLKRRAPRPAHLAPNFEDFERATTSSVKQVSVRSLDSCSSDETDLSFDEKAASLMWNINMPTDRVPENLEADDPVERLIDTIRHWDPSVHEIIRSVSREELYQFYGRVGCSPTLDWRERSGGGSVNSRNPKKGHPRIWFIGDCFHPMLPTRAMGGNQAMCDAGEVCKYISKLAHQSNPINNELLERSVFNYEAGMIPRAFEWVEKSNTAGGVRRTLSILKAKKSHSSFRLNSIKGKLQLFFVHRAHEVDAGLGVMLRRLGGKRDNGGDFDSFR